MRFEGTLTRWNAERGYGTIESTQGGEPIFVHISAWPRGSMRPREGQAVSFEVETGPRGKRARGVQLLVARRAPARRSRDGAAPWGAATLFAIPAFLVLYVVLLLLWPPPVWVPLVYFAASVAAFLAYAVDKSAAERGAWRVSEGTLHMLALAGGWPGALLAQQMLRHKSTKASFRQVFWATVLLNVAALVVFASPARRLLAALA